MPNLIDAERTINEELYRNPVTRPTVTIDCKTIKWKHEPPVIANKIDECIVRFNRELPADLMGSWRGEKIDAPDFIRKAFHLGTPNKMYFKYTLEEEEKNEMNYIDAARLRDKVTSNVLVYFNKNFVITKPAYYKEASPDKFELPEDILAEENKFGSFCHAIISIYMREGKNLSNFVFPIDKRIDPKTHKATVRFSDGTDVSCEPTGDDLDLAAKTNDYFAQDICYAKKILGSTSAIRKCLKECDVAECRKKAKERHKKLNLEIKEEKRNIFEKWMFEDDVKRKMVELRIEREANRRLNKEERRRNTRVPSQE